jgi:hypothetical protein
MSQGVRQKCRVFLEGREVPFQGATLFSSPNSPLVASIDLVPLECIRKILPKTQIQIMVVDSLNFGDLVPRLAFDGEVFGRSYTKAQNGRGFSIKAIDYSSYWDEAKAYCYNANFQVGLVGEIITGAPPVAPPVSPAGTPAPTNPAADAAAIIASTQLASKFSNSATLTSTATVLTAMVNLILSGSNTDIIDGLLYIIRTLTKTNFFYQQAFDRLRINERTLFGSSGDLTAFLKSIKMDDFLNSYTGKQGGMSSLREMLLTIAQLVFHEFVSIPFPAKLPKNGPPSATIGTNTGSILNYGSSIVGQFMFIPDGYTLPPPKCNVVFPNQVQKFSFEDDFRQTPTRYAYRYSMPEWQTAATSISSYPVNFYPPSVRTYMFKTKNAASNTDTSLLGPSTLLTDPNGLTYANTFYGAKNNIAPGATSISPTLRQADFLTNEESIRGIFDASDTFAPSVAVLAASNNASDRQQFFDDIGQYMFFKKRFAARNASADLLFNPFIVPGFNCLLVDDSDAGQSIIAKVQSVVHNLRNDGCSTSIQLGYARDFDEVDALTGNTTEPVLPPWFDEDIFGGPDTTGLFPAETTYLTQQGVFKNNPAELSARIAIKNPLVFPNISTYFQGLLGVSSLTDYTATPSSSNSAYAASNTSALVSIRGAVSLLTYLYQQKSSSDSARDTFVYNYIRRPIPSMYDAFLFLGAKPAGATDDAALNGTAIAPDEFATFVAMQHGTGAGRFDGLYASGTNRPDSQVINLKRQVINQYVNLLKTRRGFRG